MVFREPRPSRARTRSTVGRPPSRSSASAAWRTSSSRSRAARREGSAPGSGVRFGPVGVGVGFAVSASVTSSPALLDLHAR